jgi:hypothetical protein
MKLDSMLFLLIIMRKFSKVIIFFAFTVFVYVCVCACVYVLLNCNFISFRMEALYLYGVMQFLFLIQYCSNTRNFYM